jgi:TPR repeat protein
MCQKGEVVPGNLSLAWKYFKEGAESGNALAQHYLAFMYSTGLLGETNEPEVHIESDVCSTELVLRQ